MERSKSKIRGIIMEYNVNMTIYSLRNQENDRIYHFGMIEGIFSLFVGIATFGINRQEYFEVV
jgi:hypothetical protein